MLKNTSWSMLSTTSTSTTGLLSLVIISRSLKAEDAGIFLYLLWVADVSIVLFGMGFQNSITKFLADLNARPNRNIDIIKNWILRKYFIGILAGSIILYALTSYIFKPALNQPFILISLFILRAFYFYYFSYISGLQNFKIHAIITFISNISLLLMLFVFSSNLGVFGILLSYLISAFMPIMALIVSHKNIFSKFHNSNLKKSNKIRIWKYSLEIWIALIISVLVWSKLEIFFIEKFIGIKEVAIYNVALTFSLIISQVPALICGPLLPHFATLHALNKKESIIYTYRFATIIIAIIVFPLSLFLTVLTPVLIPLIYGLEYNLAILPAQILIIASMLSFATVGSLAVLALGKSKFIAFSGLIGGVILITLCYILIPLYDQIGAALSRAITQALMIGWGVIYINNKLKLQVPYKYIFTILIAAVMSISIPYLIIQNTKNIFIIFIGFIIGSIVYLIILKKTKILFFLIKNDKFYSFVNGSPLYIRKLFF